MHKNKNIIFADISLEPKKGNFFKNPVNFNISPDFKLTIKCQNEKQGNFASVLVLVLGGTEITKLLKSEDQ